jgi:hypothetical protein
MACVLLLAVPAMGITWDGSQTGTVVINLNIDGWAQVQWQNTVIDFNGASDWWSASLANVAYASCPDDQGKIPTDAWAGDDYYGPRYYEAAEGADIFVRSNATIYMDVTTTGDMTRSGGSETLPTWFTLCFEPFLLDDVWLDDGAGGAPGNTDLGCYAFDGGGNTFATCTGVFPNQTCFPCAGATTWTTGAMDPEVEGTLSFKARVERNGMADQAGSYTTNLNVSFY